MTSKLARRARASVSALRPRLPLRERWLFDLLRAAGDLGFRLPVNSNLCEVSGVRDPRLLLAPLLDRIRRHDVRDWAPSRNRLARRLAAEFARRGGDRSRPLLALVSYAGAALAPDGKPPVDPILAAAFGTLVRIFPKIYASGIHPLGRLPFVDTARLLAETKTNARRNRKASGRRPGLFGRELAVDPRLMARIGRVLKKTVSPGFEARYIFYSKPGDFFWPHPDDPKYAANVMVCLERRLPADGGRPSCFFACRPDGSIRRVELKPGEALAVEARGIVHGREPLRRGEKVTLLSIELVEGSGAQQPP